MNCRLLKVLILLVCLCLKIVAGIAQLYDIRQFTTSDGLPANSIYGVFMDSRDFLWISGEGGFTRFDGKKFYTIKDNNGNPVKAANIAFEDSLHELWGMTINGSYKFNGKSFVEYPFQKQPENLWVTQLFLSKRNTVCQVIASGVFELKNNVWQKIPFFKNDSGIFYNQIVELDDGNTLFNFRDRVCLLINKTNQLKRISSFDEINPVFKAVRIFDNHVFLFTNRHLYEYKNDSLIILYPGQINASVTDVNLDAYGKLWVGIENYGVMIFDFKSKIQQPVQKILLGNNYVGLYQDRFNNMWIAGRQGLYKATRKYSQSIKSSKLEICNIFNADNKIIAGRINGEPCILKDDSLVPVSKVFTNSGSLNYKGAWMRSLAVDDKNRIWFGNYSSGIYRLDGNAIEDLTNRFTSGKRLMGSMAFNKKDNAVFLSGDSGIVEVRNDSIVNCYKVFSIAGAEYANAMKTDKDGRTWFCLKQQHTSIGFIKNGRVHLFKNLIKSGYGKSSLAFDNSGNIYVSTIGEGIYNFHLYADDSVALDFHFTANNGLPSVLINAVDFDKSGRMWVASYAGIFSIRMIDSVHYNVSKYDLERITGITDWLYSDLFFDGNSRIYFSANDGMAFIECDKVIENLIPPKAFITNVNIGNEETNWQLYCSSLSPFFYTPVNAVLPFSKNQFIIHFTSACYTDADNIFYSYKINNTDSAWIFNGASDNVSLINLAPGDYAFKLRARTANSAWSSETILNFTIKPPWWRTWWFYISLFVLVVAGLLYYIKTRKDFYVLKIKTQQELHELEQTALRSQMNPHFIFNSLRSIQTFIGKNDLQNADKYLVKFSKLIRMVLEHSMHQLIAVEDDLIATELYLQLEQVRSGNKFDYNIEIENSVDASALLIPPMLLQPFIENSIWHGINNLDERGTIEIKLSVANNQLCCSIKDNGKGLKHQSQTEFMIEKRKSLGMSITKKRIELLNDMVANKASVIIKDLTEGSDNSHGVLVEIILPLITE